LLYCPCVSCLAPQLRKTAPIQHKFAIIEHKSHPINGLPYEKKNNSNCDDFDAITDFIASSEIIITNTYHMIYWSQIMRKKVIVVNPFSSRFDYLRHPPQVLRGAEVTVKNVEKIATFAEIYPEFLNECVKLNLEFFEKVKVIVREKIPSLENFSKE
jgi:hypothetical protein